MRSSDTALRIQAEAISFSVPIKASHLYLGMHPYEEERVAALCLGSFLLPTNRCLQSYNLIALLLLQAANDMLLSLWLQGRLSFCK